MHVHDFSCLVSQKVPSNYALSQRINGAGFSVDRWRVFILLPDLNPTKGGNFVLLSTLVRRGHEKMTPTWDDPNPEGKEGAGKPKLWLQRSCRFEYIFLQQNIAIAPPNIIALQEYYSYMQANHFMTSNIRTWNNVTHEVCVFFWFK